MTRVAVCLVLVTLAACGYRDTQPDPGIPVAAPATAVAPRTAREALDRLPVKGRAPMTGYSRDKFGPAWADVDKNKCSTREDILGRDLRKIVRAPGEKCTILSGVLLDPYTGQTIRFVRGPQTSEQVQIDHLVSLGNAWATGAQQLSPAARLALANDPINLLAVSGEQNLKKRDGDAATFLPPARGFWCQLVSRQVAAKWRYELWITPQEKAAMVRVLNSCPDQELPTSAPTKRKETDR